MKCPWPGGCDRDAIGPYPYCRTHMYLLGFAVSD